jgi:cobalt-zinc-cadmium efflux system membrane fusion protein
MNRSITGFAALTALLSTAVFGWTACERAAAQAPPTGEAPAAEKPGSVVPAAAEPAEPSDLDRPAADLLAQKCEHGIPQHDCNECRYEVGMVPVPPGTAPEGAARGGLVATTRAESRTMPAFLDVPGEVAEAEDRTVHVAPRTPGAIRSTAVGLGDEVQAGEVLASIDSREVAEAKGTYLARRSARALALRTLSRERSLATQGISAGQDRYVAQAAYEQAEIDLRDARSRLVLLGVAEAQIDSMPEDALGPDAGLVPITAPLAGTMMWLSASLGELTTPDEYLFVISDLSVVWVWADAAGDDMGRLLSVPPGTRLPATVTSRSLPGETFRGQVDPGGGVVDEATRTLRVRATVQNPDRRLRPGMFVEVRIEFPAQPPAPAVPAVAVLRDEERDFVFVRGPDAQHGDFFVRRPVTVGRTLDGWTEILAGLAAGAEVATTGAFLLKSDVLRSKMGAGCAD